MEATPAVDTIALASAGDNEVKIINLKLDREIMKFKHSSQVQSITFSTMSCYAYCVVASGSSLNIWNLNEKTLAHTYKTKCGSNILSSCFLPNSTTIIYSTTYATSKMNIDFLDNDQSRLEHLLTRSGGTKGIQALAFSQNDAGLIFYGSDCSLWRRHIYTGTLTLEMRRENHEHIFLGPIVEIISPSLSPLVFTRHQNSSKVQMWSDSKKNCKTLFTNFQCPVSALAFHPDLHHIIVGGDNGNLCRLNIQSGNIRGNYPPVPTDRSRHKHINRAVGKFGKMNTSTDRYVNQIVPSGSPIVGIVVSPMGGFFIAVNRLGYISKWDVKSGRLLSVKLINQRGLVACKSYGDKETKVTRCCTSPNSMILAILTTFGSIFMIDTSNMCLIRKIGNIRVTGFTQLFLNYDGRRLYTSNTDGTIMVYDVPTNACIDKLSFSRPILAMALDPKKGLLATIDGHDGGKAGIRLWRDRSFYETLLLNGR